jgi:hypothetical protein
MQSKWIFALGVAFALQACGGLPGTGVTASVAPVMNPAPAGDGVARREPVFFNGKLYDVSYRFDRLDAAYAMIVEGQRGRALTVGDGPASEQLAISSLSHFACPTKLRAKAVQGSLRHEAGKFHLKARCGG